MRAQDLAEALGSSVLISRAVARLTELQLHRGHIQEVATNFETAERLLKEVCLYSFPCISYLPTARQISSLEAADITRLYAWRKQLLVEDADANALYEKALSIVSEFDTNLSAVEASLPVSELVAISADLTETDNHAARGDLP